MSSRAFDPRPAAEELRHAWAAGTRLPGLRDEHRPQTLAEGRAVRACGLERAGCKSVGWKLGLSNSAAMRRFGLSAPLEGPIPEDRVFDSDATIALPPWKAVTIELELAVVLARPIAPAEVLHSCDGLIRSCRLALEIVSSCFEDRLGAGLPSFAADGTGCFAVVLGDEIATDDPLAIGSQAHLQVGDRRVTIAGKGADRPNPKMALLQFLNDTAGRGETIPAGSLIMTGALVAVDAAKTVAVEGRCDAQRVACRLAEQLSE